VNSLKRDAFLAKETDCRGGFGAQPVKEKAVKNDCLECGPSWDQGRALSPDMLCRDSDGASLQGWLDPGLK